MDDRGLNADGTIAREGALDRVQAAFAPVVEAARARIAATSGGGSLDSACLYGSVPRGTAVPGSSDLDVMLALRDEPSEADRAGARAVEKALSRGAGRAWSAPGFTRDARRGPGPAARRRIDRRARREGTPPGIIRIMRY